MTAPSVGTVGWVQVGTDQPETAKSFYGELFDWSFTPDPNSAGLYDLITFPGDVAPRGGIMHTGGTSPNHAIFYVVVADVTASVAKAERLGGKLLTPVQTDPTGLVFAELHDPSGNHFAIYTPPPA